MTFDEAIILIKQELNRRERQIKELRQEAEDSLASQESNNLI